MHTITHTQAAAATTNSASDTITILTALEGRVLAKRIESLTPEGILDYDAAEFFDAKQLPVSSLTALAKVLKLLEHGPGSCVIRGELIGTERRTLRRRANPHSDGYPVIFKAAAHRWIALDLDKTPYPPGVDACDLKSCGSAARATLPEAFRKAMCLVQASGGHGIKATIRVRLWFWCSRPVSDSEAREWLADTPTDRSLFNPVQVHYTAAPVFMNGLSDLLPKRLGWLTGEPEVQVPSPEVLALAPPEQPRTGAAVPTLHNASAYIKAALVQGAKRVAGTAEGGRHPALVAETASLGRFVGQGEVSAEFLRRLMTAAARQAGMDDEGEIASCIAWGLDRAGCQGIAA